MPNKFVSAGAFSYFRSPRIASDFRVGRYCSVAQHVSLSMQEHPLDRVSTHPFTTHQHMASLAQQEFGKTIKRYPFRMLGAPPDVGNDVWIGDGCTIKRGISIGDGAVIAAKAFVTKSVPPYAIVGGVPARVIRYRFDERTIERLLRAKWWQYNYADFGDLDPRNVRAFLDGLEDLVARGGIAPMQLHPVELAEELFAHLANRAD